jgi:uncharacterized membrane-anchored protein YitT (DUF2179 family)
MVFSVIDKTFSKTWFKNYAFILFGALAMAAGYVFFIVPNKIVPGGVLGLSVVIHYLTEDLFKWAPEGLPVGMLALLMNIPLVIIGIRALGPRYGVKTILGFVLLSVFIDLLTFLYGHKPLIEDDMLLSSIYGGVLVGFGLGLIFKSKASSGGSDIIAMVLYKYTRVPPGQWLIYIDSIVVLIGLVVIRDWKIPFYSLIIIFLVGKVVDTTLQGRSLHKAVFIITDKYEEVRQKIIYQLNRGGTTLYAQGMFREDDKKLIFVNVNRRELAILEEFIREVDPNAFFTVINTHEIIGKGFKSIKEV